MSIVVEGEASVGVVAVVTVEEAEASAEGEGASTTIEADSGEEDEEEAASVEVFAVGLLAVVTGVTTSSTVRPPTAAGAQLTPVSRRVHQPFSGMPLSSLPAPPSSQPCRSSSGPHPVNSAQF